MSKKIILQINDDCSWVDALIVLAQWYATNGSDPNKPPVGGIVSGTGRSGRITDVCFSHQCIGPCRIADTAGITDSMTLQEALDLIQRVRKKAEEIERSPDHSMAYAGHELLQEFTIRRWPREKEAPNA